MAAKVRKFRRPLGNRPYRKLFVIAVEGARTEPQYFAIFKDQSSIISVKCLKDSHGKSPPHVLKRMKDYLKQEELRSSDEAWLVVDKDQWTDAQLARLHAWTQTSDTYNFALSNPKFEYWLLLHFEDGNGIQSSRDCDDRLKRYLPGYDKGIDISKITRKRINDAIRRARQRDNPPCIDWPRVSGTTVYRLVEHILQAAYE
jgi:hypothetical protein